MNTASTLPAIHPIEVRWAFGGDRNAPAIPGRIIGSNGHRAVVVLITGTWVTVAIDDPRYVAALEREDLRWRRPAWTCATRSRGSRTPRLSRFPVKAGNPVG